MHSSSQQPRYRLFSVIRKMNSSNQPQSHITRAPKQEMMGNGGIGRRYVQQAPPSRSVNQQRQNAHQQQKQQQQQQHHQQQQQQNDGEFLQKNGKPIASVTIENVLNHAYLDSLNNQSNQLKVDEDKLPVFLIKLWNIVEDSNLQSIVHWDESGASFHIADPYSFCRNVLPHFFKHNNLNSLIRQLNMYGFRKMTPLSQGGLTRTESDQDHLEFSHPCFVQGRPELLSQIKRKSGKVTDDRQVNEQTQQNLEMVMTEMRSMREKAKHMEDKMNKLTKENRDMWNQMGEMRQQHARQQQYFKKLLHFLVSVMQPGLSKRVAKRGVLEIDFGANNSGTPNSKRTRMNSDEGPYKDVCDLLESLQREAQEPFSRRFSANDQGPLISEVTDEFGNSPGCRGNDFFGDSSFGNERVQSSRYSDAASSREQSPHPIISQPSSCQNMPSGGSGGRFNELKPPDMYMGSGALTHENVHRSSKRDYQGHPIASSPSSSSPSTSSGRIGLKRSPYKHATRHLIQNDVQQNYQDMSNNYNCLPNSMPAQLTYQSSPQQQQSSQKLMAIEDLQPSDTHQNLVSPTLGLSTSFDRQLSQEIQEYLSGYETSMDGLRDLVVNHNWDDFGDNLMDDEDDPTLSCQQGQSQGQLQYPLALKNAPESSYNYEQGADDLLDPFLNEQQYPEDGFDVPDPNYVPLADEKIYPNSPALRTPSPSDPNMV